MTTDEKLIRLKRMMRLPDTDDDTLLAFLDFTRDEILSWRYGATGSIPDTVIDVPLAYESVRLNAVMIGWPASRSAAKARPRTTKTEYRGSSGIRPASNTSIKT